jgi:hypothetical protein
MRSNPRGCAHPFYYWQMTLALHRGRVQDIPFANGDRCWQREPLEHTARSPCPALVQQLNLLLAIWACSHYGCFAGFGTGRLRCERNENRWATKLGNRAHGADGQNRSCSSRAAKQKNPAIGVVFFLDFSF